MIYDPKDGDPAIAPGTPFEQPVDLQGVPARGSLHLDQSRHDRFGPIHPQGPVIPIPAGLSSKAVPGQGERPNHKRFNIEQIPSMYST